MRVRTVTCLLLALALGPAAAADILLLKDGRILERDKIERAEGGVKARFENGEVFIPSGLIQEAVLAGEPPAIPDTPEAREMAAKGLVPFEGKWVKPEQRDAAIQKRLDERKAAVEEVRKHTLWRDRYKEETKHFKFEYTVAPHVFAYFRDLMETYYDDFTKAWKVKAPKEVGKLTVCFYTDREAFHQTGGVGGGVEGYFRFVPPLELNFYYARLDPYHTEQVMYHETNHYLQLLLRPDFSMPHFPGESIAEYYGASTFDPKAKKLNVGQILEGRLTEVQTDVAAGEMMGLEKMVSADEMYEHYNWGWSLVHFLMNDKGYAKKFEKFVDALVEGKDVRQDAMGFGSMKTVKGSEVWAAFRRVMGLKTEDEVKAMEAAWHAYVKDNLKLVTSTGLEKAATAAMNTGRSIKAKRLFREAIEKGSQNPMTFYRYADLLADDRKFDEAIAHLQRAIELEPLASSFYAELGRVMGRKGDDEARKRYLALARELDPDNPWLEIEIEDLLKEGDEGKDGGGKEGGGDGG
jgi:tetratricopeptide (TPR) repeat protein